MSAAPALPPLPAALAAALAAEWSIIPVGADKRPPFSWACYQNRRPTEGELSAWLRSKHPAWAVITGALSGLVILDFDGDEGAALAARWQIRPHVRTGSGGLHWYIQHPGHRVKTLNSKADKENLGRHYPGLDIRADGGYALFYSAAALRASGHARPYEWLREAVPDPVSAVPADARRVLGLDAPPPAPPAPRPAASGRSLFGPGRDSEDTADFLARLVRTALDKARSTGRNNGGAWLAEQLRDAGLLESDADAHMLAYQRQTSDTDQHGNHAPYNEAEARRTLASIYARPRREPARSSRSRARGPFVAPQPRKEAAPTATVTDNAEAAPPPPQEPKPGPGRPPSKSPRECLRTDLGNAERLILRYGRDIRFCHPMSEWLIWDGRRWAPDTTGAIYRLAFDTVRQIQTEGADTPEPEEFVKWGLKSQDNGRIKALVHLAQHFPGVAIEPRALDSDPFLFNCENGTLDLRNGELQKARRDDLITKLSPVSFSFEADYPVFDAFVDSLMLGRADMAKYLQRAFGYALTGIVSEKAVFVLHGHGDNGKTTLLEAFRHVMGEYASALRIDALMQAGRPSGGDRPNPDIVALRGARYVTTSEAEDGQRLNESLIKHLTGMGTISARGLYEGKIEFPPAFKLFLDSNYRPKVRGQDKGIWTRLKLIPFDLKLTDGQKDRRLGEKLQAEAAGILKWALYGCLDWLQDGLGEPDTVRQATAEYRASMDTLGQFLEECCLEDPDAEQMARPLYGAYVAWTRAAGEHVMAEKDFAGRLQDRHIRKERRAAGVRYFGIRLKVKVDEQGNVTPELTM